MKQRKSRKATMKEVETVVNSLIMENQSLRLSLEAVQRILSSYIEFKKDENKFKQYIEEKNGNKDTGDNLKNSSKK